MEKNYNIDDIEKFLNQEMNTEDLAAFEKEMVEDKGLVEEVNFHEEVIKGIQNAAPMDFRNMVTGVHQEIKQEGFFSEEATSQETEQTVKKEAKIRSISWRRNLAIAASFALLLVAGWWMISQPVTPEQMFANNFKVHQDVLSVEIEDRLAETGFGTNKEALNSLQAAINTYNTGNYSEAINQFNVFQTAAPTDALAAYAQFYEAVAMLQTGKAAAAQKDLFELASRATFPLQDNAKWYLALAYLKQGNTTEATNLLQELSLVEAYKDMASKMLKHL